MQQCCFGSDLQSAKLSLSWPLTQIRMGRFRQHEIALESVILRCHHLVITLWQDFQERIDWGVG